MTQYKEIILKQMFRSTQSWVVGKNCTKIEYEHPFFRVSKKESEYFPYDFPYTEVRTARLSEVPEEEVKRPAARAK